MPTPISPEQYSRYHISNKVTHTSAEITYTDIMNRTQALADCMHHSMNTHIKTKELKHSITNCIIYTKVRDPNYIKHKPIGCFAPPTHPENEKKYLNAHNWWRCQWSSRLQHIRSANHLWLPFFLESVEHPYARPDPAILTALKFSFRVRLLC